MSDTARPAPKIRIALWGNHTRYMLAGYLRHITIVLAVLLAIALTIDLWPQFQVVAEASGHGPLAAIWNIMRYSALRTPGLVAPFLAFATYLGVFWTEVGHTQSGERMLVWNSGRSPLQCLAPVLWLGLILGTGEFVLDACLGPAAMGVQMEERFGLDGQRLNRSQLSETSWIALPGGLMRAEIEYGPPAVLHHLTFFKRNTIGRVTEVDMAPIAQRLPGTESWLMHDGYSWQAKPSKTGDGSRSEVELGSAASETMTPFVTRTITLDLEPEWLGAFGMEPQYIPLATLRKIAASDQGPESKALYRTRLQVLYGELLLPGAMALLAALLSMMLMAYNTSLPSLVGIVFAGYVAHFGTKACLLMGQTGNMNPVLAGWLVPVGLVLVSLLLLALIEHKRKGRR
jgi:lipopolysaccharide export system permease protein